MGIRFATEEDGARLVEIYGQYIHTPITFEYALPSREEFARRIRDIGAFYPYLVWEQEGRAAGYAYAHRHLERPAYQWNAELSIYLDGEITSRGVGRRLYGALFELLKLQGVKTVYGNVTVPNEKSGRLHRSMGFQLLGTYHNTGFKCGAWHDVAWFEKTLAPYGPEPHPVISIRALPRERMEEIFRRFG